MNKKRWLLATASLVSLIGVPILVIALVPPRPGVTKVNFDRIEEGMTSADVERILGNHGDKWEFNNSISFWTGNDGLAVVRFDEKGRVTSQTWTGSDQHEESWFDKMQRWLPWKEKQRLPEIHVSE